MLNEKKPQNETATSDTNDAVSTKRKVLNVVGIVLCVILIPILILNCILIVKGLVNEDEVPSIGKTVPLIVLTESMEPDILGGDLIFVKKVDAQSIKVDDVIAFFDPEGNGTSIVTHKVIELVKNTAGETTHFRTYGINNFNADGTNEIDRTPVPVKNLVGLYEGNKLPIIGNVAMFMQSTAGLIICIFIPLAAFVLYEVLRRKKQDQAKQSDIDTLMAELNALKAAQLKTEQPDPSSLELSAQDNPSDATSNENN